MTAVERLTAAIATKVKPAPMVPALPTVSATLQSNATVAISIGTPPAKPKKNWQKTAAQIPLLQITAALEHGHKGKQ